MPDFTGFEDGVDYKGAHLRWLQTHKDFLPSPDVWKPTDGYLGSYKLPDVTYLEVMQDIYSNDMYLQKWAFIDFKRDMLYHRQLQQVTIQMSNLVSKVDNIKGVWFVTIGFNHQTYTDKLMLGYMEKLLTFDWVQDCLGKFEIYRTNGMHPHVHMKLETQLTKSKIIEKLMRCKNGSKLILKKEMIDVKSFQPYHDKYLAGEKVEAKMDCVMKDADYREKNGIPHIFRR